MGITAQTYFIVLPLIFFAGFVDSIAGGGGLISVPTYLAAGLSPHYALGKYKIRMNGEIFVFRHYNDETNNPIRWGMKLFASGNTYPVDPSYAAQSLLLSLISSHNPTPNQIMLFSRPSAWADIEVTKTINSTNGTDFVIDALNILINYDFMQNNDVSSFEVVCGELGFGKDGSRSMLGERVMPLVSSDKSDLGDRRDGRRQNVLGSAGRATGWCAGDLLGASLDRIARPRRVAEPLARPDHRCLHCGGRTPRALRDPIRAMPGDGRTRNPERSRRRAVPPALA